MTACTLALVLLPAIAHAMTACTESVVLTQAVSSAKDDSSPPESVPFISANAFPVISFNLVVGKFNRELGSCNGLEQATTPVDARMGFKKIIFCCDSDVVVPPSKTFNAVVIKVFNRPSLARGGHSDEIGKMVFPFSVIRESMGQPRFGIERFPLFTEEDACVNRWDIVFKSKAFTGYPKRGQPGVRRPPGWYYYGVLADTMPAPVPVVASEADYVSTLASSEAIDAELALEAEGAAEGTEAAAEAAAAAAAAEAAAAAAKVRAKAEAAAAAAREEAEAAAAAEAEAAAEEAAAEAEEAAEEAAADSDGDIARRQLRRAGGYGGSRSCAGLRMVKRTDFGYATVLFKGPIGASALVSGGGRMAHVSPAAALVGLFGMVVAAAATVRARTAHVRQRAFLLV